MTITPFPRRTMLLGAAAAALLPMQQAVAQTSLAGGDWFQMVQAHHALIAQTLEEVVGSGEASGSRRARSLNKLAYQLTAHSVAEENVLYPALAMNGMTKESDMLYIDQSHAKVLNAEIDMAAAMNSPGSAWLDKAKALQAAILKHAKEDEEASLYPRLQQAGGPSLQTRLTMLYQSQFSSVRPSRVV